MNMPAPYRMTPGPGNVRGISSANGAVTVMDSQISRAEPIRRRSTPQVNAPTVPPIAASDVSRPMALASRWMSLTRNTTLIATMAEENRFAVEVQPAIIRRIGWRTTNRRPSAISARRLPRPAVASGAGSRSLIASSDSTETT